MTSPSILATPSGAQGAATLEQLYEHEDTRALVALVDDGAELIQTRGEAAFDDFRIVDSQWRRGETYVFVLDPEGNMLVHPDPALEGKNVLDLQDINGKPIIRGLIDAVTAVPGKIEGWYHYEWFAPDGLLPRWKSSYVRLVSLSSGKRYIVGSGVYNDRMERAFVVDAVTNAVGLLAKDGEKAFEIFRDPSGPFITKNTYLFVIDLNGVEIFNPFFPSLVGRNVLDITDSHGKYSHREMIEVVESRGAGWVDYMWPKPGESVPTQKSAYVSIAKIGDRPVLVGSGVYLADAPKEARSAAKMTAPELITLVREGAAVFQEHGEKAFTEFRRKGSRWFRDDTYFFVWTMEGVRAFHAPNPEIESENASGMLDVLGRPIGKMILDVGSSATGEGWVHYMYPEPNNLYPVWKSTFVKRVTFPSGKQYIIGCGIYNMEMDKIFIEDVVNRAATLVAERGTKAFGLLRDKTGPFLFMDTYVFVESPEGVELVNPAQPSLEGKNLITMRDLRGKALVHDEVAAAMTEGHAWIEGYWYKPGDNTLARKQTFLRRVDVGRETFIVGSGLYTE